MSLHGNLIEDNSAGENKNTPTKTEPIPKYSIPLIKLIPQISNQVKYDIRGGGVVNLLVNNLTSLNELEAFSEWVFGL